MVTEHEIHHASKRFQSWFRFGRQKWTLKQFDTANDDRRYLKVRSLDVYHDLTSVSKSTPKSQLKSISLSASSLWSGVLWFVGVLLASIIPFSSKTFPTLSDLHCCHFFKRGESAPGSNRSLPRPLMTKDSVYTSSKAWLTP